MGIGKTLNKKLEDANCYGLRTMMNMGKRTNYESVLRMVGMNTLKHRRIEYVAGYVANLFKPRVTPYNVRGTGLNVVYTSYHSTLLHGSYKYIISRVWNQLSLIVKDAPNVSSFRRLLNKINFTGCQCSNCL